MQTPEVKPTRPTFDKRITRTAEELREIAPIFLEYTCLDAGLPYWRYQAPVPTGSARSWVTEPGRKVFFAAGYNIYIKDPDYDWILQDCAYNTMYLLERQTGDPFITFKAGNLEPKDGITGAIFSDNVDFKELEASARLYALGTDAPKMDPFPF